MRPIPRTFFITGMGRSGTAFLASALATSSAYRVVHEWRIPRTPFRDGRLQRFPLWRFAMMRGPLASLRPGYGEVNSHLRRTVSPTAVGREAFIERRGVILRDPRDLVASAMNRRDVGDFEAICDEKARGFAHLLALLDHPTLHYERFEFRRFTRDAAEIRRIAAWAGIHDVDVPDSIVARKVNTNKADDFPRWPSWTAAQRATFDAAAERYGVAHAAEELAVPAR